VSERNNKPETDFMKQNLKNPPAAGRAKKAILDRLISLGLTKREAEVLTWIAQGKGNYEIGVILGARTRTICKHVERILTKLKVENRTAAAATAFAVCSQLFDLF
jgi:DNA-binding NarL/FixJ family response regulator